MIALMSCAKEGVRERKIPTKNDSRKKLYV